MKLLLLGGALALATCGEQPERKPDPPETQPKVTAEVPPSPRPSELRDMMVAWQKSALETERLKRKLQDEGIYCDLRWDSDVSCQRVTDVEVR